MKWKDDKEEIIMLTKNQIIELSDNNKYKVLEIFNVNGDTIYATLQIGSNTAFYFFKEFEDRLILEDDPQNVLGLYKQIITKCINNEI